MAIIKHKDGSKTTIDVEDDVIQEMLNSSKVNKEIDEIVISRTVSTFTEKERAKIKDLCTEYKIDIIPLDRDFVKHKIFIRENTLKEAFKKLIIVKTFNKH